jgi:hypothetical protein
VKRELSAVSGQLSEKRAEKRELSAVSCQRSAFGEESGEESRLRSAPLRAWATLRSAPERAPPLRAESFESLRASRLFSLSSLRLKADR